MGGLTGAVVLKQFPSTHLRVWALESKELVGGVFGGSAAEERIIFVSKFVEGHFRVVKTRSGAEDDYDNND